MDLILTNFIGNNKLNYKKLYSIVKSSINKFNIFDDKLLISIKKYNRQKNIIAHFYFSYYTLTKNNLNISIINKKYNIDNTIINNLLKDYNLQRIITTLKTLNLNNQSLLHNITQTIICLILYEPNLITINEFNLKNIINNIVSNSIINDIHYDKLKYISDHLNTILNINNNTKLNSFFKELVHLNIHDKKYNPLYRRCMRIINKNTNINVDKFENKFNTTEHLNTLEKQLVEQNLNIMKTLKPQDPKYKKLYKDNYSILNKNKRKLYKKFYYLHGAKKNILNKI